ncbi:RHS repeat-associated core domain-containing protein [Pseudomonas fluorescens]|uniref:RHS repeat-associated core domain-containing protein n=1 Tax=Pseudomonas fluorescens TaxID=294 RepID=UPI002ACA779E|nr:RHS repeat-associated core domain-containing protein [Pseudomonas fluorescens]MDZ5435889.1 RHS repeat-associated core domain-containing protein [Pseudomonas fluorescens]
MGRGRSAEHFIDQSLKTLWRESKHPRHTIDSELHREEHLSVLLVDSDCNKDEAEHSLPDDTTETMAMGKIMLCRYSYDPLDRLIATSPLTDTESQRFYCKDLLATEIQGQFKHSIFQCNDQLLAEQQSGGTSVVTMLVSTDQQRSVLRTLPSQPTTTTAYSPYGYLPVSSASPSLLKFNGERQDPVTGYYLLGNGYRAFSTILMRFISPDSWSPFGEGGLNPYAYCLGDPINQRDPSGHGLLLKSYIKFAEGSARAAGKLEALSASKIETPPPPYAAVRAAPSNQDKFNGIIERVSKSFNMKENSLLQESIEISNSKKSQIYPGTLQSPEKATRNYNFYNNTSEFNFLNGVPQTGEKILLPNGAETFLFTGHFDASISYFSHKLPTLAASERTATATKLRNTVLNRIEYIRKYSQELPPLSRRAPRGASPVGWRG